MSRYHGSLRYHGSHRQIEKGIEKEREKREREKEGKGKKKIEKREKRKKKSLWKSYHSFLTNIYIDGGAGDVVVSCPTR